MAQDWDERSAEDDLFWMHLGKVVQIFKPIHKVLKKSEFPQTDLSEEQS
jgi:hypothetical protein